MIVELKKSIQAHGEQRNRIELREPNGGDIAACGYPFRFFLGEDGSQMQQIDANAVTALIARLGEIPRGSANQLSLADWNACMTAVFGFFGVTVPDPESLSGPTSSTVASTLPGSGNGTQRPPSP
jgi:Phage tail assembly chaperone proteins, E, or 41 or 14